MQLLVIFFLMISSRMDAQVADMLFANPQVFLGGAGVAGTSTADSVALNPAHAGAAEMSEVMGKLDFTTKSTIDRFPGFEARSDQSGKINFMQAPAFIYKVNRNLGVGGIAIPFKVGIPIEANGIPIVILGQQNYVDLIGNAALTGLASGVLGFRTSPAVALGTRISYDAFEVSADLFPAGQRTNPLVTLGTEISNINIEIGTKMDFGRVSVGLNARVLSMSSSKINLETELIDDPAQKAPKSSNSSNVFDRIRLGTEVRLSDSLAALLDLEYTMVKKGAKQFSLVDLTEKTVDQYDTLSAHSGVAFQYNAPTRIMGGFQYIPSSKGAGSPGKDGKTGLGAFDRLMGQGDIPNRPLWAVSVGAQYGMQRVVPKSRTRKPYYRLLIDAGFVYSESSIGIGSDGEQPAAYLTRTTNIPARLTYRF